MFSHNTLERTKQTTQKDDNCRYFSVQNVSEIPAVKMHTARQHTQIGIASRGSFGRIMRISINSGNRGLCSIILGNFPATCINSNKKTQQQTLQEVGVMGTDHQLNAVAMAKIKTIMAANNDQKNNTIQIVTIIDYLSIWLTYR